MKNFLKVFFISLFCFVIIIIGAIYAYSEIGNNILGGESSGVFNIFKKGDKEFIDPNWTPFEKAIHKSDRINVLVLGLEHERTDTIMVASYDKKTKEVDVISIPRDTYCERDGFVNSGNNKINTVYTVKGIDGIKEMVKNVTNIPVQHYVTIDYDGVSAIVNAVGGVEVNVPFPMKYSDPYSDPPLYIDIDEGKQLILGDRAMEFLRFRKSNHKGYTGYAEGDIGRIKAQQEFVKSFIKKALSFKLPQVISDGYKYVDTDFTISEATSLAISAVGASQDKINFHVLPGKTETRNRLSFYISNSEEMLNLVYDIYDIVIEE